VPASLQSSAGAASHRSVLLLEEYDALAAAIGSALKKFAPQHEVSVARSLDQAKKLAAKIAPELLVIDVDPPWPGLTDFLEKMRSAHANARALVIGAAIPSEIAAERRSFGALQFIEKPFELAAFGAAVQALLGPWRESESESPRGTLRTLNVIEVILLSCAANAPAVVEVDGGARRFGEIHFAQGQVTHVEAGKLMGAEALREILTWPDAEMHEAKKPGSVRRPIQKNWVGIVVEALREARATQVVSVSREEKAAPAKPRAKAGKKIVAIDDTEMLLIFVEDVLATADPDLQITTALNGTEGLKQIEQVIPDLVLLDYSLPDLNGDEVCRRLLQNERTANVPVLMMSGHVPEMRATEAQFENVIATIEKPFLSDALVSLVQQTLTAPPRIKQAPKPPPKERQPPVVVPPTPAPPAPVEEEFEAPRRLTPAVRMASTGESDAVLGLFLEVVSMQLTSQLQMGTIRARPASLIVSLHLPWPAARNAIPGQIGFQLGATELDGKGRISTVRLIPTAKPFQPSQTRSAFEIGGVAVIPNEKTRAQVQLTPAGTTPMTMELLAHLEVAQVELSATFELAQLILKWRTNEVRVTLNPKAPEQSAARFEASAVKLDGSGRIAELLLNPIK
jgi:DNA-binding response OmpR family regulator